MFIHLVIEALLVSLFAAYFLIFFFLLHVWLISRSPFMVWLIKICFVFIWMQNASNIKALYPDCSAELL